MNESGRVIEDLERRVNSKTKEKVEIEKEKKVLEMEIKRLVKEVAELWRLAKYCSSEIF